MCFMSDQVFRAIGKKVKRNMDHINKTDINDISISYVHKKINLISKSMSYIHLDYDMFVMEDLF